MLRHNVVTSILRFYNNEHPADFEDYVAVCSLLWESKDTIWIHGFHGNVNRKHLRTLLKFFIDNDVKIVKAKRSPFRVLPLSNNKGDHHEIVVDDLIKRFVT